MTKNVHIKWITDYHDCDDCGLSQADGAMVYLDEELIVDLSPSASCFDSETYGPEEILTKTFEKLGLSYTSEMIENGED